MHGVSHPAVTRAFDGYGLKPFIAVEEQKLPDPEFSTVRFPNPEEKGISSALLDILGFDRDSQALW